MIKYQGWTRILVLSAALAAVLIFKPAHADEAQKYPLGLELGFDAAEAADMMTTLDIKYHSNLQEENPILGNHPSQAKIYGYFSTSALIHAGITKVLVDHGANPTFVKVWEYVSIGTETGFAAHNLSIGLRFKL